MNSEETLMPVFDKLEKGTFTVNDQKIEFFSLDGIIYSFGVSVATAMGKTPSNLYQSIRRKKDWKYNVIFKLGISDNSITILGFMNFHNQGSTIVLRITEEFLIWLSEYCLLHNKRSIVNKPSERVVVSGEIQSQTKYKIKDKSYYLFTVKNEKFSTTKRFCFVVDVGDVLGKNVYNFTKRNVTFYTPDSKLKSDMKSLGLISENSHNQNLLDFDDVLLWNIIYLKFEISKPQIEEGSEILKEHITEKSMRRNLSKIKRTQAEMSCTTAEILSEIDEEQQISSPYQDTNDNDVDYIPPTKRSKQPNLPLWSGVLRFEKPPSLFQEIPICVKDYPSGSLEYHDIENWPNILIPLGTCASNHHLFQDAISKNQFITLSSQNTNNVRFQNLLDKLLNTELALTIKFAESKSLIIMAHKSQIIGILLNITIIQKTGESTIQHLTNENKRLESELMRLDQLCSKQKSVLSQISTLLKSLSASESSELAVSSFSSVIF